MNLIVERQMVKLWDKVNLHLNDSAETVFHRLKNQGVKLTMTAASHVIISRDKEKYDYTLYFEGRFPSAQLTKIEKDYHGYSWSKPKSTKVWQRLWQ